MAPNYFFVFLKKFFKIFSGPRTNSGPKLSGFLMCCLQLRQTHTHHLWWWKQGYGFFCSCSFFLPWAVKLLLHFIPLLFFFFFNLHLNTKGQLANFNLLKRKMQSCLCYFFNLSASLISFLSNFVDLSLHCFSSLCIFHRPLLSSFRLAVDKS